jgi:hypothetical protein
MAALTGRDFMAAIKPNMFRVYLNAENSTLMQEICERIEVGQSELLTKLVTAALRAVKDNNYRISLPLKFEVKETSESLRSGHPLRK